MRTLCIVGDSRSGSTLLQHLLALQDGVVALGEVRRLQQMAATGAPPCACGRPVAQCPFWTRVASLVGSPPNRIETTPSLGPLRRRVAGVAGWAALRLGLEGTTRGLLHTERRAATNCLALHRAATELTSDQVVVDASKVPSHFLHLRMEGGESVRPVLLVRDGRAVVWSKMHRRIQKGKAHDAATLTRQWLNVSRIMLALQKSVPGPEGTFVYYEELCKDSRRMLEDILAPLGVAVRTTDLRSVSAERHDLGGSPRFRESLPERIELDERWRTEMPKEVLATFERIGGRMNRRLGYG
ncbi:MAG: sulfotransferase [Actinomycetota bacterium]|nr:sulfotransferase [Actinomycetota bacterium]